MKYFFISYVASNDNMKVGGASLVVACSCCIGMIYDALLNDYNEHVMNKANNIAITSLTVLDKETAVQLSNNLGNGVLIIDDGENEEEKQEAQTMWLARDKSNDLWLYISNNQPRKDDGYWSCDEDTDCMEIDGNFFNEVQWSDEEPTKVKLVIDK